MNSINGMLDHFTSIHLDEMDKVKLLKRVDTKYWFHIDELNNLLYSIKGDYSILDINNNIVQLYATTYYDTDENEMFLQHQNGKLNRYKVRRRSYILSDMSFLEVKFKNNKRKTFKNRIPAKYDRLAFTRQEKDFLEKLIPYDYKCLTPIVSNKFSRITLVNKNFKERCTIDFDLSFKTAKNEVPLKDLIIIEIKTDGRQSISPLVLALRNSRIKSSGFSKYCIGCSVTNQELKRNNFKRKIRRVEQIIRTNHNLYEMKGLS